MPGEDSSRKLDQQAIESSQKTGVRGDSNARDLQKRGASRYAPRMSETEHAVMVNGAPIDVPSGCTVRQLLSLLEMSDRRVAVAVNRDVIPRSSYDTTQIASGDRVEILEAVGGG